MPAKTSNGTRNSNEPKPLVGITDDSINASGGAIAEAQARLNPMEFTLITFFRTGERRTIKKGDFYILGTPPTEGVYIANFDGDEYDIADFKVAQ